MAAPLSCGFRFSPTDQELVVHYLKRKVDGHPIKPDIIPTVDIYKCEPSELPEKSFMSSTHRQELEWYLFAPRDRKYPNGGRTNRATPKGYWKSTGNDRPVLQHNGGSVVGMKKTLVFHKGRAPKGRVHTEWVMHEYRLTQASSYALCRLFKKKHTGTETREGMLPSNGSEGIPSSLPPPSSSPPPPPPPSPPPPPELTAAVADGDTDKGNSGNCSWRDSQLNIFNDNHYSQLLQCLLSDDAAAAVAGDTDMGNADADADLRWADTLLNISEDDPCTETTSPATTPGASSGTAPHG